MRRSAGLSPARGGRLTCAVVALSLFAALLGPTGAFAEEATATQRRSVPGVVETVDGAAHHDAPAPLVAPERSSPLGRKLLGQRSGAVFGSRVNGSITTTYENDTPRSVRTVIDSAVGAWDQALALSPTAPVEISVRWIDLGPRLLGQAGTEGEYRNADRFPTDRWYPAALANQLANVDVNGADTPEVLVELNSGLGDDWYIGTSGQPGSGQIDLYSVVLHEIAHGLGFLGSALVRKDGTLSLDLESPSIYDNFLVTVDGDAVVNLEPAKAIEALTSESLRFDVGFGRLMPIHSPARFVNGSSYSHFEEGIPDNEAGAMMTPALKNGESQRQIDAAVLGVLDQIGWNIAGPLLRPTLENTDVRSGGVEVTWTEDWTIPGVFPEHYDLSLVPLASSGTTPEPVSKIVDAARASSVRVRGLQNGTSYQLSIAGERTGAQTGVGVGTTLLLPPNPNKVLDLQVARAANAVGMSWTAPVASGESVTSYEVSFRRATERKWQTSTVSSPSWSGDLPEGRYWFRVRGLNRVGSGLWEETSIVGLGDGPARPMPLDGQLARLYEAYFDRSADAAGIDYWRAVRSQSVSIEAVSDEFARSTEFGTTYGPLGDEQFIDRLYRNVLDRSPDPEGYEYWLGLLDAGVARGTIVLWFSESAEFVVATNTAAPQSSAQGAVERLHLGLLRRAPSDSELERLVLRGQATSLQTVATELSKSDEFRAVWNGENGADLAELIAESVGLGAAETTALAGRLADGERLSALLVEMTQTPAFILSTGTLP